MDNTMMMMEIYRLHLMMLAIIIIIIETLMRKRKIKVNSILI